VHERLGLAVIIFLTACTKNRQPILASEVAHRLLLDVWQESRSWMVGRYVIMPDHLHLFCAPAELQAGSLPQWVSFWKSRAAQRWHPPHQHSIWQRDFWDTQLRRGESYDSKWEYVVNNPVRAGLVGRSEDWPYQGEVNLLRW
jgi:REP element-mobilizing transposase RayT